MVRVVHLLSAVLALFACSSGATALDWDAYELLLKRHTRAVADTAGVRVDYAALPGDPQWRLLIQDLESAELPTGHGERLAFWINAYNILAIQVVVSGYPVAGIRDLGSFWRPVWDRPAGRVGGQMRTLGEIEHEILRPLAEPRIHAAIVCASVSCPSLRREAFRAERLEDQLDDNLRRFLADPDKGSRLSGETLTLSPIFNWFEEDFEAHGGVRAALLPYLPETSAAFWSRVGDGARIRYFDYDWSLNDDARAPS